VSVMYLTCIHRFTHIVPEEKTRLCA